ncbi:MAG: hypothetical protein WA857_11565 [Candidatus Acidiferrum sp.]
MGAGLGFDEVDGDVDVAAGGFGIRASLVTGVNEGLGDIAGETGEADVKEGEL